MKTIGDLLERNLSQRIEEVIKVDQTDEQSVFSELTEYVVTDRLAYEYRQLLAVMAEAPSDPHEGIGVWVSGFFGSGKSSFIKNLGYALANREVLGHSASELFKHQVSDRRVSEYLDFINQQIPTEVIMFDVSVDRAVRRSSERIAEVMYTVLLRELGYAQDYDIAELEIELEGEGQLDEFVALCQELHGMEWERVRKGAQKISRASAILHHLDPVTYPNSETWSQSLRDKPADITVGEFVKRAFELSARRRPGRALVFIIDEVGQYVARSADKIEDLRAVVEQFGKESKNRVKERRAVSPTWIVVTSQEKLDEVVAAIDSRRVELAKLQDRFRHRIDLAPADIREVATRRVLSKKPEAVSLLSEIFQSSQGQLNAACHLERTARSSDITEDDFIQFYPYLPHFIEMSIDIMSGIRLQPGAPKHLGGSNRTIIKQAYEMLVSERTALATQPVGTLVTLDKIFELVEGNLSSEKQKDISDISQTFANDHIDGPMAVRVAKAIALLEFVRDLPRTENNIAACLVDQVGAPAPRAEVERALEKLERAQFIRNTEEGWKLQTAQEKNWETERQQYLRPKTRDRNDILREILRDIFETDIKTYRYGNLRNFRVGITVDEARVGDEGQITLALATAEDVETFHQKVDEIRGVSRRNQNDIYWVYALTPEIDNFVAQLFASRQMVNKYDQLRAQNRITPEETACLSDEKSETLRYRSRLRDKVLAALESGTGIFQGVATDGSALGRNLSEIVKAFLDSAVPALYPKLEMGSRPINGKEPEQILAAANLNGLPQVFYGGERGLDLVTKQGAKQVVNPAAPIAREILDYLNHQYEYGETATRTGKHLETHFGQPPYGWEGDMLRLVLATLFRGGSIEVSYQGQRFDTYQDPRSRDPFATRAFRNAVFTPVKPIDLRTLTRAVEGFEGLTGQTVDVERNAIAAGLKDLAVQELQAIVPLEAVAQAHQIPVQAQIQQYKNTWQSVLDGSADNCVHRLADEGTSLREMMDQMRYIQDVLTDDGIAEIQFARTVRNAMWPVLAERGYDGELAACADELAALLDSETFYQSLRDITARAEDIAQEYDRLYGELHAARTERYVSAIDQIRNNADWENIPEEMRNPLLARLTSRACEELRFSRNSPTCANCRASVQQLESDLAALDGLTADILTRIQEIVTPPDEVIERVRVRDFFARSLDSQQAIQEALAELEEHLLDLLDRGARIIIE